MGATGPLEIIPLGGLGEIGMNLLVYGYDNKLLIVDCGLAFPGGDAPGVDVIIPDVGFLIENRDRVVGFVLTHGHEDHMGAMPYVWPNIEGPIYGSAMTLGLLRGKFREHRLLEKATLIEVGNRQPFQVGPFNLCMIQVSHSIVDSSALAIKTPLGTVIHTGDFKIDHTPVDQRPTDLYSFARHGESGVLALLSDSTNINRRGATVTEQVVSEALSKVFAKATGLIIVATFASNIQRIQQIFDAAAGVGRKVVISGRSMQTNIEVARGLKFLRIPEGMILDVRSFSHHERKEMVVLSSGSQGEHNSSLSRIAHGEHRDIDIRPGDTVVLSSRFIPGNEQTIWGLVNRMSRAGAEVIHEYNLPEIHVSGHAPQEDLKLMLALTRPKYFIPIHGEIRHLHSHRALAIQMGVAPEHALVVENGQRVTIGEDGMAIDGQVPSGRVFVDGKGIGDISDIVLRDRRHLSEDGLVVVVLVVEKSTGNILQRPELLTRGVIYEEDNRLLLEQAKESVEEALRLGPRGMDFAEDEGAGPMELAQRAVRRFFKRKLGRRPAVIPLVMEM
ncbi:MAG: ribonuclease J [Magnetococcales bacterium]|nr:ribonuclease J [Magnetococcales bacterium]MBF0149228.1 ribonuclease J [Magnetococcales bacterium]MBF0171994.1 ribonuclease J [Magnetococcales bacterium]MBF0346624.1 ribonuclease J [Magnetococcales bacterium]MBF0630576.1 ribonuclease J [Magnetococcales bacterium]